MKVFINMGFGFFAISIGIMMVLAILALLVELVD